MSLHSSLLTVRSEDLLRRTNTFLKTYFAGYAELSDVLAENLWSGVIVAKLAKDASPELPFEISDNSEVNWQNFLSFCGKLLIPVMFDYKNLLDPKQALEADLRGACVCINNLVKKHTHMKFHAPQSPKFGADVRDLFKQAVELGKTQEQSEKAMTEQSIARTFERSYRGYVESLNLPAPTDVEALQAENKQLKLELLDNHQQVQTLRQTVSAKDSEIRVLKMQSKHEIGEMALDGKQLVQSFQKLAAENDQLIEQLRLELEGIEAEANRLKSITAK